MNMVAGNVHLYCDLITIINELWEILYEGSDIPVMYNPRLAKSKWYMARKYIPLNAHYKF